MGQRSVVDQLRVALDVAFEDGRRLDDCLLVGPPGLGKTQVASVLSMELATTFHESLGQSITSSADLNALLLAAKDKEHGRWRYKSSTFTSSGRHSPSRLRHTLKSSVAHSLKAKQGHRSDQHGVWDEVARQQESLGVSSITGAMADTFKSHAARMKDFHEKLAYPEGATGFAVAVADKIVSLDLFDKATVCQEMWDRLLSGSILDALETGSTGRVAEVADVERLLTLLDIGSYSDKSQNTLEFLRPLGSQAIKGPAVAADPS